MTQVDVKEWFEKLLKPTLRGDDTGPPDQWPGGGLALLSADTDHTQTFGFNHK